MIKNLFINPSFMGSELASYQRKLNNIGTPPYDHLSRYYDNILSIQK